MTNIWKKGPLTTNPYYETAFQVLGITRETTARAEIGQIVDARRQAVEHVPGFYTLGGRDLTQVDITNAREILFNPTRRILEELLEHKPESLQVDEIQRLQARLALPEGPDQEPPPRPLAFLLRAVQEFARAFLEDLPPVEVPPFPIDVHPIPPFGLSEEANDD